MEIFVFFIVIIFIFIIIAVTQSKKNLTTNDSSIVDTKNDVQILLDIWNEHEQVINASLKLIREMSSEPEHFTEEDLRILKIHEHNSIETLDAIKGNISSFASSIPNGNVVLKLENFKELRDSFHDQLAQSIAMKGALQIKSIVQQSKESSGNILSKEAKSNFQIILSCINTLKIAGLVTIDYKTKARNYIEVFLIDMAAVDDTISTHEINLLNEIFSQNKSLDDYNKQYLDQNKNNDIATKIASLVIELGTYSQTVAQCFQTGFYELVLNMIASDGTEDERELNRLSDYINILNKKLGIETKTTGLELSNVRSDDMVNKESENEVHSLEDLLTELSSLVGLKSVKQEVNNLCNLVRVNKMREQANLPTSTMSLHLVFTGNPGTRKTTVARLLAKIFNSLELLSKGHLVEVGRSGLVGGYVGQTAIKTKELIERSLGGILFIDEAYSLTRTSSDSDYGREAIETLLKAMEDNRENLVIIVAGYPNEMNNFINSNPGLKSRFSKYVNFPDYDALEMMKIMEKIIAESSYNISPDAEDMFQQIIKQLFTNKTEHFGNARTIRNLFEHVIQQHSNRIITINNPSADELQLIKKEDVSCFLKEDAIETETV